MSELSKHLAAALREDRGAKVPRVIVYDPEVGPGDAPGVYLPEIDELPGADSNGE